MEKRISYSQYQSVKCVAKACDPLIAKRNTLKAKIEKLAAEYKDCDSQINSLEAGVITVFGLHVEQLVKKVIEPGVDVNGKPKKTTKYLPTDIVSYDEQHKQYVITLPDAETTAEVAKDEVAPDAEPAKKETTATTTETETTATEEETATTEDAGTVPSDAPIFG